MLFLSLDYNLLKEENRYWFINYFESFTFSISIMCFVCKLVCFLSTVVTVYVNLERAKLEFWGKPKITGNTLLFCEKHDLDSENLDPRPGFLLETQQLNQISLFFLLPLHWGCQLLTLPIT